jgi:undecaprenyl diphosphate synthase
MDGNGRWATQQGKERYEGHIEGVASVRACIKAARRNGVRYLTLYAFSTENWGRPQEEVEALMQLFCRSVTNETPELVKEGVRVRFIGRRDRFSEEVRERLLHIEQSTAVGDKLTLVLAFDYSSRDEIMRATRELAERVAKG